MYKNIFIVIVVFLFVGCGGTTELQRKVETAVGGFTAINSLGSPLYSKAKEITETGGMAAVGEFESPRQDWAIKSASGLAKQNLSEMIGTKVVGMASVAQEQIADGSDVTNAEMNEAFKNVVNTFSKENIKGAYMFDPIVGQNDVGLYHVWVLMSVNPKILNAVVEEEIKKKNIKTYERYRTTQLFNDLKKEEEEYDKKKKELETIQ